MTPVPPLGKNRTDMEKPEIPAPLPYHRTLVELLQSQEQGLWKWFASTRQRGEQAEAVKLDLLKSTYRLDRPAQPKLYELADEVRERIKLSCSVTLYQAQTGSALNAALAYLPGEAHVILGGPLASVLSENELRAVLAHELAHFLLLEEDDLQPVLLLYHHSHHSAPARYRLKI